MLVMVPVGKGENSSDSLLGLCIPNLSENMIKVKHVRMHVYFSRPCLGFLYVTSVRPCKIIKCEGENKLWPNLFINRIKHKLV